MNTARKLPPDVVDQLFRRMVATYGRRFWAQWEGVEPADVKAVWARELGGYTDRPEVFTWAFENLPEQPPNAIEFRNLCRRAPPPVVKALPEPPADPERVRAELAKLQHILQPQDGDRRAWARRALERADAGEPVSGATLRAARAVLRTNVADPAET
jgi:hypothetical protein